jgi:ribosomal protein L7Ae-like RNA K-turn-binding protein
MKNRFGGLLGISRKAGKLAMGADACIEAMTAGQAYRLFLSQDAGESLIRKLSRIAEKNSVPLQTAPVGKAELGRFIGRPDMSAVAVTDQSLAQRLSELSREAHETMKSNWGVCE